MAETKAKTTAAKTTAAPKKVTTPKAEKPAAAPKKVAAPKAEVVKELPTEATVVNQPIEVVPAKAEKTLSDVVVVQPVVHGPVTAIPVERVKIELPKSVFGVEINTQAVRDTVVSDRATKRQGTHKVKHRGEVRGGGKKPWAQKGTGNARAGSTRGPIWVGGGVAFGPENNTNYNQKVNKKVKQLAMKSVLTDKAVNGGIIIINNLVMSKPSTQTLIATIDSLKLANDVKNMKKVLIVTEDANVFKSAQNVPHYDAIKFTSLSVEQIMHADVVLMTADHVKRLEGLGK